jgi:pimeloyl-ACP methyl ester carboxylesterase
VRRAVISVLVVAACSSAAAAWPLRGGEAKSGFVSVDGHEMYYECSGAGTPTVVLDAGSPDTSATWRSVQPQIAKLTRVCAYDRAGLGRSSPAPQGPRTPLTQIHDLRAMLNAANIAGPYVVVGHSWGGLLARLFAFVYPHLTAGVVLVDATTFPYLTPATAERLRRKRDREGISIVAAVTESAQITSLGQLPLIVLGSNKPPLDAKLLLAQDAEAALSTNSIDAIARQSTHYIQRPAPAGQPQLVIAAVDAVVEAARQHHRLPRCRQLFSRPAAGCR